jgi:hypothetical protein
VDWKTIHKAVEEVTLWTQLFINLWVVVTGISAVVSAWAGRKLTQMDVLILAGLAFILVAWAFACGFSWWLLVELAAEQWFRPLPLPVQIIVFAIPTAGMFWFYAYQYRQQIGKK